jgi:hypothetical protein
MSLDVCWEVCSFDFAGAVNCGLIDQDALFLAKWKEELLLMAH